MTTKPTGVWLREGDLVYRLADTPHGVSNCDEITVTAVDGRRLSALRQERAEDLRVALEAVERAKAWRPPHDGIRTALAAVPPDGEWRGFAAECAQQYGAEYLDDDAKLVVMTEENLVNMMAALGYPTHGNVPQAPVGRSCSNDDCGWTGPESETVHAKHDHSQRLCPRCHETTEPVAAPPAADSMPGGAALPMQPICFASDGVFRFKKNRMVNDLYEFSQPRGFGLNEMARRDYTQEERMQFAQLIGYSVSGYGSLTYASPESVEKADAIADLLIAASRQGGA